MMATASQSHKDSHRSQSPICWSGPISSLFCPAGQGLKLEEVAHMLILELIIVIMDLFCISQYVTF